MHIIKPNWVIHDDDKGNPQTIYSIHVHPDGTRLATGSIQNVIKIWSTAPILDPALENSGEEVAPRLLCRMEGHDGAVLCVRWSYSGSFLATSSDDAIVMVWLRATTGNPTKSFGSKTVNIEDWKPFQRLPGHTSDVTGVAWSHDDQYLASVGLDSLVLIWSYYDSFDLLRRLDLHQGFVKGVVWDPVGQFLATQSDDRTVKIWRTNDWKLEADIREPFVDCPTSTFFRRLGWSPDGAHIVTPNAMNGPVFVSAVIDRDHWSSHISLVGHENVVEVAAYNPNMFLKDKSQPVEGFNICSVLALGARNSISIWLTNSSAPILVLHDVFDRDILDLTWAADGITLYACSSEGHVAALVMNEILSIIHITTPETRAKYLQSYKFEKTPRSLQPRLHSGQSSRFMSPHPAVEPYRPGLTPQRPSARAPSAQLALHNVQQSQEMTIMPNGKRRIRPVLLGQSEATMFRGYPSTDSNGHTAPNESLGPSARLSAVSHQNQNGVLPHRKSLANTTLGDDLILRSQSAVLPRIEGPQTALVRHLPPTSTESPRQCAWLDIPPVQRSFSVTTGDQDHDLKLECQNFEGASGGRIQLFSSPLRKEVWSQEIAGRKILALALNASYAALGCDDGTLMVYTPAGRHFRIGMLHPTTRVLFFDGDYVQGHNHDMVRTDVTQAKSTGPPIRLADLVIPKHAHISISLTSNGRPIVDVNGGVSYTYDRDLTSWIVLKDQSMAHQGAESLILESELNLRGNIVLGRSDDLEISIMRYLRALMTTKSVGKIEEFCSELWRGQGALFSQDQSTSSARLTLLREDRIKLLKKVIDLLSLEDTFLPICQEYLVLLRHVP